MFNGTGRERHPETGCGQRNGYEGDMKSGDVESSHT